MASDNCTVSLGAKSESILEEIDAHGEDLRYLHVEHDGFGRQGESLMQIAHRHRHIYRLLTAMAERGFMVYMQSESVSRLVRDSAMKVIWQPLRNNAYKQYRKDVIYTMDLPEPPRSAEHLVVVFSDASGSAGKTSLSRYFSNVLDEMKERIPGRAAILRIGDVGGVCGTAHLGNQRSPDHARNIQDLIAGAVERLGLSAADVTLAGVAMGGVAAMFHGLLGSYPQVVAAPCLPTNDVARPWYNPCFLGQDADSLFPALLERYTGNAASSLHGNCFQLVVSGQEGNQGRSSLVENMLQGKDCLRLTVDSGTGASGDSNALLAPLYVVLSLRALGSDISSLHGAQW